MTKNSPTHVICISPPFHNDCVSDTSARVIVITFTHCQLQLLNIRGASYQKGHVPGAQVLIAKGARVIKNNTPAACVCLQIHAE